jgi:hypothetical protein
MQITPRKPAPSMLLPADGMSAATKNGTSACPTRQLSNQATAGSVTREEGMSLLPHRDRGRQPGTDVAIGATADPNGWVASSACDANDPIRT